jgi:hypothetical protein
MTKILFEPVLVNDVSFLANEECLYSIDFRATGESLHMNITAMFKYENLSYWLGDIQNNKKRNIIANETSMEYDILKFNVMTAARMVDSAHTSIYARSPKPNSSIKALWVGVPHPEADDYAQSHGLSINYKYKSFLAKNDKLAQKACLGDLTPKWKQYDSIGELTEVSLNAKSGFLKHRSGAGGFKVFDLSTISEERINKVMKDASPEDWYIEESVDGVPWSVQCVKEASGDIKVFSISRQKIEDGSIFCGAEIFDISTASENVCEQIEKALNRTNELLDDYIGFFGIDFILAQDTIHVLELNVRLTAVTIPSLLRANAGLSSIANFTEDRPEGTEHDDEVILTRDYVNNDIDVISFN